MNSYQSKIKKFAEDRKWAQFHNPKDLLLGIVEEVGEIRNVVKWEQDPIKLKEAMVRHREEVEDDLGDILWYLALMANGLDIDLNEAISKVIDSNEIRFPLNETVDRHTNTKLGGIDHKYN
jgi:NTP pyrophosphatase (non-canonical NTP hydrolase)